MSLWASPALHAEVYISSIRRQVRRQGKVASNRASRVGGAEVINPKPTDIGRKVVYREPDGWKVEEGVISSFNDTCVFVRYGADTGSRATRREGLDWLEARPDPTTS